jgi:hypothetical protein
MLTLSLTGTNKMRARLCWQHPDPTFAHLVVWHPNYTGADRARFDTDEAFLHWIITEHLPAKEPFYNPASPPQVVQEADWPTDHTFVDAWEWED